MKRKNNILIEDIHEYMDGNLSDSETDQLWAQLLGSPDELDYMQTMATLKKMGHEGKFDSLDSENEKDNNILHLISNRSQRFANRYKHYLVAASALILGMAILFQITTTTTDYTAELLPIASIEFDIERSADIGTVFDTYLQRAVSLSTAGDVESALNELNAATALDLSNDQIIELKMVEGSIYYNAGFFAEASEIFENVSTSEHVDRLNLEKSLWYLANTQLQLNELEEAKLNIEKVIELDGAFSRVASNKFEKFD